MAHNEGIIRCVRCEVLRINTLAVPEVLAAPIPCPRHGGSDSIASTRVVSEDLGGSGHLPGLGGPVSLASEGAVGKAPVMPPRKNDVSSEVETNESNFCSVLEESPQLPSKPDCKSGGPPTSLTVGAVVDEPHCKIDECDSDNVQQKNAWDCYQFLENGGLENVQNDSQERYLAGSDSNMFAALSDLPAEGCTRSRRLRGKALTLVRYYKSFGLRPTSEPPGEIRCGGLRAAVRSCFPDLDAIWELSFKTISKVEKDCCSSCLPDFEKRLDDWIGARFDPVTVDSDHLARFKERVRGNVQKGWDRFRRPFIPNGHATLGHGRKTGGNWNVEGFSEYCEPCLVFSSGKPRIVTKYSSWNTSVLGELHYSLYHCLKQKGWLLVGDPTDRHVQRLTGADLLSFDYSSATDNIKAAYVATAVSVLKEQAECLSSDEIRTLDVLANLKIDGYPDVATRGQPMGSVMSFPLLCIINKSVVDLALCRMLEGKEISFSEWSSHRCLINGDDLLTREVRSNTNLRGLISEEGSKVGLVVNTEKTMSSPNLAEINSTLFSDGIRQRKFNASSIWMDAGVEDVLGFASQACPDAPTFRRVVRANAHILAKQQDKHLDFVPFGLQRLCAKDRRIRAALTSLPNSVKPREQGPIRMVPAPSDYALSINEEHCAMREEIQRVRDRAIQFFSRPARMFSTSVSSNAVSYRSVRKKKRTAGQEVLPACYVRCFHKKKWESQEGFGLAGKPDYEYPFDGPVISHLIDLIRSRKREIAVRKPAITDDDPFRNGSDFVSFGCL